MINCSLPFVVAIIALAFYFYHFYDFSLKLFSILSKLL